MKDKQKIKENPGPEYFQPSNKKIGPNKSENKYH